MTKGIFTQDRRQSNISSVYRHLYDIRHPCTKAYLASSLGLSLPTIYQCLNTLLDQGLIRYEGIEESNGGRPARNLTIAPDARVAVGVSILEDRYQMVLTDLYLNELSFRKVSLPLHWQAEDFSNSFAFQLEDFLEECQVDRSRVLGVGIAFPGIVSIDHAKLLYAPTLGLKNINASQLISHIPYPVFWENDANCSGQAEWFARKDLSNMAYLSLQNGVGGAVLIGGSPYVGDNLRSGEFGHMCVEPAGLPCKCGKRGCLEAYCSAQRITGTFGVSLPEFFEGLNRHVPEYEVLWHDLLRHLAIGIHNIRMALDCDVVLGGFLTEYLPPYMPVLQEYTAANNTFGSDASYLKLSVLRQRSVPLGAALHFFVKFPNNF